ncbi:MAG: hypothetical protein E7046_05405 [Lentisphaerae bacterium]|nr:hypothetical protein [Lentisphaerota bacterium]
MLKALMSNKQERKQSVLHTAELWARCAYGIGYGQFASFDDSCVDASELPWTCPENSSFPWLDLDHLYIEDGDAEHANLSAANLVCEGAIIDASLGHMQNCAVRYAVVSSTDPVVFEFELSGAFDISRLTIHYKTMAKPGAPDFRLVTSAEYDGRQIYSSGSIVRDCEMPSGGDLGELSCNGTICGGWHIDSLDRVLWHPLDVANTIQTLVVPAHVEVIDGEAFAGCGQLSRLYVREGAERLVWAGQTAWRCVKVPGSLYCGFMDSESRQNSISNFFFSGAGMNETEFLVKEDAGNDVRWLELKPSEFQYVCSLAFDMPREECDLVGGRWLFTPSVESSDLLIQLAAAFLEGREVEQDLQMALRCCEQACWCAVGDGVPFTEGESFPGIEVAAVNQFGDREIHHGRVDMYERANRLKEEVLTHFQRIDIRKFEMVGMENDIMHYFIPANTFEGRDDLRDVLLPDELRDKHVRIGRCAFAHCPNLRSISVAGMADSFVLSRHSNSFDGCDALSDRIQYSADGSKLLYCLNAPEHCVICGHVHMIANFAFVHSRTLSDFRWESPDYSCDYRSEPREVGFCAFMGCNQLSCVFTGGKEISLHTRAFASCRNLSQYRFGYGDIETDSSLPPPLLDVSGMCVFDGCEMLGFIESGLGPDKGFLVLKDDAWRGCQFSGCRMLHVLPPVISTSIPAHMFADCASLSEVRCLATRPEVIKSVLSGKHPNVNPTEEGFSICTRAFAGCSALERFKFCRLRVSLRRFWESDVRRAWESDVELIDDNAKQVLFEHEAFLDCNRLSRHESSFAGVMIGSDPSAFRGCPDFEGFVSE